ncbi:MAG TPA: bifunctional aspartate kinase/homoserine dehydrogenase I [Paludibacteraceae bacterium]|nr:bifunctional aspartate kinase/homoserine dehydrogenase I [Paludibacteraceae bacterium]HQB69031.1 bifunctional aspartate kinase/homoserine dehydrogenase I [Paludibacteraceae bacterium]HRS67379.1 bifunctional aspartate kinase/homoserine dehydrogenase I [Paludibacteraceae bacterium]
MKVLKFGGSSVGSLTAMCHVKNIVETCDKPVVVVVSALAGVTDTLYDVARMASKGDRGYIELFSEMEERHVHLVRDLGLNDTPASVEVAHLFEELRNILRGVHLIQDISERIVDSIVSYGERLSSIIVAQLITGAEHLDSRLFIKTKPQVGTKCVVDFEITNQLIDRYFVPKREVVVCGGFISSDVDTNHVTNLGRGGSDYTAAILAAQLNASVLEIWTDVDGFMTADPRIIDTAYRIEKLTFVEAMELCNFGAKVIYPPTIFPVFHKNIPIRLKNTAHPEAPGTYISHEKVADRKRMIKGISSIDDTALITIQGLGMVGVIGINYRIFKALAKNNISVFMVSQASSENTTSFAVCNAEADHSVEVLRAEFAAEMANGEINDIKAEKDLATVAIVGEGMKRTIGIAGKLFGTLGRNGINVIACAQGASETNISFVTDKKSLRKALNVIHDSFFLSEYQELNVFIVGVGAVGTSLLEQIRQQQPKLMTEKALKINVVGVASSKKVLFRREGLPLGNIRTLLDLEGVESSSKFLRDQIIAQNMFNSVFVDCTSSAEIASIYKDLLEANISVVAANKIAASGNYEHYLSLKDSARKYGIKFLFETNVGAGLPVMNTINNLINSGDKILKLEAVLSGTLNFVFNTISSEIPLSKAILMAKEAGFTESDPRTDLSGTDVIRKLVILTREAGYRVTQEEVKKELFLPDSLFQGTLEEFWQNIKKFDAEFEQKRRLLDEKQMKFRFVATMIEGRCSVALKEADPHHPFYDLEGSNNILMLTTERYYDYPMIIKGAGAGADVTAAGVFADIISIANIR